jgi:hypothetical protein
MKLFAAILFTLCFASLANAKYHGYAQIRKVDWLALWVQSFHCESNVVSHFSRGNDDGETVDVKIFYVEQASADAVETARGCIKAQFDEMVRRFGYSWAKLNIQTEKAP